MLTWVTPFSTGRQNEAARDENALLHHKYDHEREYTHTAFKRDVKCMTRIIFRDFGNRENQNRR